MISNQILQNTIDGLKGITRTDLCVIDVEGKILAATFPNAEAFIEPAQAFVASPADSQVINGCQFFKVFDDHQLEYVLLAYGDSEDVYMIGKIASFQIQNLLVAYKERFDKDNFIKNLLLDNLLLVDIYNRAKKLHIDIEVRRVVFIVETNREKDGNELEKIRSLFGGKSKDFVTAVDEKNIIVVKTYADAEKEFVGSLTKTDSITVLEMSQKCMDSLKEGNIEAALGMLYVVKDGEAVRLTNENAENLKKHFSTFPVVDYHLENFSFSTQGCNDLKYKIEFAKKDVDGNAPTMAFMFNPVKIDGIWYLCIKHRNQSSKEMLNPRESNSPAPGEVVLRKS